MSLQHPSAAMLLLLATVLSFFATSFGQLNQGVRLASSPLGKHAGRVEVMYNGRWGTICDLGWSSFDSFTVCRMLNFTDDICAIRGRTDVFGEGTGDVWLTNLACGYNIIHLDNCRNNIPQTSNPCPHSQDAAIICQDPTVMPVPENVTQLNATSRSVTLSWSLSYIPPRIRGIDFRFTVSQNPSSTYPRTIIYHTVVTTTSRDFQYIITGLSLNQTYIVDLRAEGEYEWCSYNEIVGNKTEIFIVQTAETIPPSTLLMKLLTYDSVVSPHVGRLQVKHNGQWGSVCNDYFGVDEANVACMSMNYTNGAICYATNTFPLSMGPIWLDDMECSSADRFQDCTHRGWGVHNCDASENIGLYCNPGNLMLPKVTGLTATSVAPTAITARWNTLANAGRYRIQYGVVDGTRFLVYLSSTASEYTLRSLILGLNYSISISASLTFREYTGGNCYSQYLYGDYSDPIYNVTKESAPTVSVRNFHVTLLNTTAVEATWSLSFYSTGLNGNVRGFKLIVDKVDGVRNIIQITSQSTRVYILGGLEESATYRFSMLIYTVADGPEGVILQITMPNATDTPLISKFGVYGNNIEALTSYTSTRGFNVLCGSSMGNTTFEWRFANGSRIGVSNPGFRAAHFANGTAVLQIGTGLVYVRYLTLCDGGVYTCVARPAVGGAVRRNFSLLIGYSQPILDRPWMIKKGSSWVEIGWESLDCDGGFILRNYMVEFRPSGIYSFTTAGTTTSLNYTVRDLNTNTNYDFRVVRVSSLSSRLSYSVSFSVTTQEAGPSPPRAVEAVVGFNSEVCLTWKVPAVPAGQVILYNVYAEIVETSTDAVDSIDIPPGTILKTFPASPTEGCMTVELTGVIYHFQMSSVALVNGEKLEGVLSSITPQSTVYVPPPGIPQPVDLQGSAANTSVTLQWSLPESILESNTYTFNVSYSGVVEWLSDSDVFTSFKEQGQQTTDNTSSITVSPLTPSTKYEFTVATVTPDGQLGEPVPLEVTTSKEVGDKLAFFQIRILNIDDCEKWQSQGAQLKLSQIRQSLQSYLITRCKCGITTAHISQAEFSCRAGLSHSISYRARLSGTASRSASDLAGLLRSWVQSGEGSIRVGTSRLHLDPTCDSTLESIHGPDCKADDSTTEPTTTAPTAVTSEQSNGGGGGGGGDNSGEVAGLVLGGIIAGLLLALLIAFAIIIYLWMDKRKKETFSDQSAFRELIDTPSARNSISADDDDKL